MLFHPDEWNFPPRDLIAFDRDTMREKSHDGHLHVMCTNIAKSNICEYYGREIPDPDRCLNLEPDRKYKLFRDPNELEKAAKTFNRLPLLARHVPIDAANHRRDLVVGTTGSDAAFKEPYLTNSLVVWDAKAIAEIERNIKKQLSPAYHYRADMTPGTYAGQLCDGVMRDIIGNHVAMVEEGRQGTDVAVADSVHGMGAGTWAQCERPFVVDVTIALDEWAQVAEDPLTDKGQKILAEMIAKYGEEKGKQVFYAARNKGTITGVDMKKTAKDAEAKEKAKDKSKAKGDDKDDDEGEEEDRVVEPDPSEKQVIGAGHKDKAQSEKAVREAFARRVNAGNLHAQNKITKEAMQEAVAVHEHAQEAHARIHEKEEEQGAALGGTKVPKKNGDDAKKAMDSRKGLHMTTKKPVLSRKAVMVAGGLMSYLAPKLAQDAKLPDFNTLLKGVTAANYKTKRGEIADALTEQLADRLAEDASIDGLANLLMAFDAESDMEKEPKDGPLMKPKYDKKGKDKKAKDEGEEDDDNKSEAKAEDEDDEDGKKAEDGDDDEDDKKAEDEDDEEDKVSKKAMDSAIRASVAKAIKDERKRSAGVLEALEIVRPYVGHLSMAFDSKHDVFKAALDHMGVELDDDTHPSAYAAILKAQPLPGSRRENPGATLRPRPAMDTAGVKSFEDMFGKRRVLSA